MGWALPPKVLPLRPEVVDELTTLHWRLSRLEPDLPTLTLDVLRFAPFGVRSGASMYLITFSKGSLAEVAFFVMEAEWAGSGWCARRSVLAASTSGAKGNWKH